jgi:hypothetical protein
MAIKQLEDGRIADEFEIGDEPRVLKDALVMLPDDYAALTPDEVQAMKQSRYDNWIAIIMAPPPVEVALEPDAVI